MAIHDDSTKISYAQNFEDAYLARVFKGQESGFYVDVGAAHPVVDSVTLYFYQRGWQGINVEPVRKDFDLLQKERTRDINLNIAVSSTCGEALFFEVAGGESTLSSLEMQVVEEAVSAGRSVLERRTPVVTLNAIFEQHVTTTIDFLKIDVEGHETSVLQGCDFQRFRPRVVIVEATRPNSKETSFEQWQSLLLENDYIFAFFDGLNHYYVRNEDAEMVPTFSPPISVLDGFVRYSEIELQQRVQHLTDQLRTVRRVCDKTGMTFFVRLMRAIKSRF